MTFRKSFPFGMVGHSKWSKVRHIKGPLDDAAFSKLVKEFTVAARFGVGDPAGNHRRRSVVGTACARNITEKNAEHAIQKGTGEIEGKPDKETTDKSNASGGVTMILIAVANHKYRTDDDPQPVYSNFDPPEETLARLSI